MNFKQLSAFREVMLTGSVSGAARNLNRTQPAISSMISGLEDEIDCRLFERRNGRLHPVPEAKYLFEEAQEILGRLENTSRTLKSLRDLEKGVLRIVSMPGPSVFLLPDLISRFIAERDGVEVSLITRSSALVQQLVAGQQFDVGLGDFGYIGAPKSRLVDHVPLQLNCLCAMQVNDPLAEKKFVSPADLHSRPMAMLYEDHPLSVEAKNCFQEAGAKLVRRFEAQYFIPLFTFIERGLACSIVDPLSMESYRLY